MDIRPFDSQDCDQVIALWQACDLIVPWNDPYKDISRKSVEHPELFLIGELSSKVVATAMGGYDGHRGWINYLAVDPGYRRRGLAALLLQFLEQRLLSMGCPKINLQIRATNQTVIDFYQSMGYTEDPVISMGKRLIPDN